MQKRGSDGRFLPSSGGGKPKSNKPKSESKSKQSDSRKKNPSDKSKSSKSKGKSQSKSSSTQRKKNPDGPEVQNLKVEVIGEKEDVQDLADAIAEQQMMTPGDAFKTVGIGVGAYFAPGVFEVITKGALHRRLSKMFAGKDKAPTYADYAKSKVVINAGWFGLGYHFTKKGSLRKYRTPILSGLGGALGISLIDWMFKPKAVTEGSARFRTVIGLPPLQPTAFPYSDKGDLVYAALPAASASTPTPQAQNQLPASSSSSSSSSSSNSASSSQADMGTPMDAIGVYISDNAAYDASTNQQVAFSWVNEGGAEFAKTSAGKYLFDVNNSSYITKGTSLGDVTEYWDRNEMRGLGDIEETWIAEDDDEELDGFEYDEEYHDGYSDDEAAYGGGSYLPSRTF